MTKKLSTDVQVNWLRRVSVSAYVALIAAAVLLMNGASQQFRWFYQVKDELASQAGNGPVHAMGSHLLLDMPYKVALIVVLGIAALASVLAMTVYKNRYQAGLKNKVVLFRWLCIGLTGALMMEIVGMVHGVQDIVMLKLLAGTILLTALLSWLAERDSKIGRKADWRVFALAVFCGLLPWLVVASLVIGTAVFGQVNLPWYAYAVDAVTLLGFSAIALNQFLSFKKFGLWKDYAAVERNYLAVGLVMKVAFAVVLIWAFKR